jgi:transcription initiation factor IIE alpha subunit
MTEISGAMVIRALYALRDRGGAPTAEEVADYLETDLASVRRVLRHLEAERLFRKRQRKGRQVWLPWEDA